MDMGFKDGLKAFGAVVGHEVCADINRTINRLSKIDAYMDHYGSYSNEELLREYRRTSGDKKIACAKLLKNRGYSGR